MSEFFRFDDVNSDVNTALPNNITHFPLYILTHDNISTCTWYKTTWSDVAKNAKNPYNFPNLDFGLDKVISYQVIMLFTKARQKYHK
jgi:hypothetical protein